jgi:hypothetical protein
VSPVNPRTLALTDLARSGLGTREARALRIKPLAAAAVARLTAGALDLAAYELPYLDARGRPTGFYRLRLLEHRGRGRPLRYWQPPGTPPRLYLPATYAGWPATLIDPAIPVYVTEGEKKAARGGLDGLPVLGLGGVWAWRSKREGVGGASLAIPDLNLVEWKERSVVFVFDSDVTEKLEVQAALRALAEELIGRGARPVMLRLPGGAGGAKVGLDDFLVAESRAALEALAPQPILGRLADELWRLNQELAYVEQAEAVWRFKTRRLVSRAQLVDVAYANRTVAVVSLKGDVRQASAAKEWLTWPCRRSVARLTYAPGEPESLEDGALNLWRGWGVEPIAGDVEPWNELLGYLFRGDAEGRRWFERWCAYPLRHPGAKLYTAVILLSLSHGVGKSLVGLTLGRIYGDNFSLLGQDELASTFNGWAAGKQFALADEVTGMERRRDADRIKNLVTRDLITINEKFQPQYVLPDRVNYLFTTNHPDAFVLERADRRFFVREVLGAPLEPAFYRRYDAWLRGAGPAALFYRLGRLDLAAFDPKAAAPVSEAKAQMVDLSLSDLDGFAGDLATEPDQHLRVDGVSIARDLFTLDELLGIADPLGAKRTTRIALAKALRRVGLRQLPPTRVAAGVVKLWAARNQAAWEAATPEARRREYERGRPVLRVVKRGEKF